MERKTCTYYVQAMQKEDITEETREDNLNNEVEAMTESFEQEKVCV